MKSRGSGVRCGVKSGARNELSPADEPPLADEGHLQRGGGRCCLWYRDGAEHRHCAWGAPAGAVARGTRDAGSGQCLPLAAVGQSRDQTTHERDGQLGHGCVHSFNPLASTLLHGREEWINSRTASSRRLTRIAASAGECCRSVLTSPRCSSYSMQITERLA